MKFICIFRTSLGGKAQSREFSLDIDNDLVLDFIVANSKIRRENLVKLKERDIMALVRSLADKSKEFEIAFSKFMDTELVVSLTPESGEVH